MSMASAAFRTISGAASVKTFSIFYIANHAANDKRYNDD